MRRRRRSRGVRAELALLRRAVEGLAAERGVDAPDYSETLGVIANNLAATAQRVDILAKSPALAMTPEQMAARIGAAAGSARREDQAELARARTALEQSTGRLDGYMELARDGHRQNLWLAGTAIGGVMVGMVLWAGLAGPIDHLVPESWHWPERRAAGALDMPMWQAGERLMATADQPVFDAILAGDKIVTANRAVLQGCEKAAKRAGDAVRCTIRVGATP